MNWLCVISLSLALLPWSTRLFAERMPASFVDKKFSITLQDTEIKDVLNLIAQQGQVKIEVEESISGKVTYSFNDITLQKALQEISKDHNLIYTFEGGVVYIEKGELAASTEGSGAKRVFTIPIHNSTAKYIMEKVPKIFRPGESLILDESSNVLVFYGSENSKYKLMRFVEAFDQIPTQIIIEGQIIETSKNFLRDIGFKWGKTGLGTNMVTDPNLSAKLLLGQFSSHALELQVAAAESAGEAKVISRPNIVTLNNQVATIHSGVTFHVKTLSTATSSGAGGDSAPVTGGLQSLSAGLDLQVLPLIVGANMVKLNITVTNSEPNDSLKVDGIPGIVDNSASTAIIVRDGNTATMAGLIKSTLSNSESRVPFFAKIPVLGWLFRSHSTRDTKSELVILIKPRIVGPDQTARETPASTQKVN